MESKTRTNVRSARSFNWALALFVALGMVTSAASLFAKDNDDKDKLQSRDVNPATHEQEDLNAKTDPEKFIRSVSYSWANEIRVGNLAKQRAQSQEVKEFADKIVQDHTKANSELKRIAQQKNIALEADLTAGTTTPGSPNPARDRVGAAGTTPNPATPGTPRDPVADVGTPRGADARDLSASAKQAHYQQIYGRLAGLSGKAFDDAFTTHMVQSHTKSVAKFEKASSDLESGELKQFVESTLPALKEHLAMAQRLAPPDATRLNVREQTGKDADYKKDQDKPKQDQDKPNK
jgi:putative membrane protein